MFPEDDAKDEFEVADTGPSVHESLSAAFKEAEETETDDAPAEVETVAEAAPDQTTEPVEPTGDRARDEQGRFAAKTDETAPADPAAPVEPAQTEPGTETATPAAAPPPGWSIAAKTAFEALPDAVKQAVAQREVEVNNGFAKLADYKGLDQHVEYARSTGHTLPEMVEKYRAAENFLERDPINGIKWMCQQYGITPEHLAGGSPQQPANGDGQQPAYDPNNPLLQRLTHLESSINADRQAREQQTRAQAQQQIDAFFADPAHKFAANLESEMSTLIQSGQASDLKEAYDKALWLNPETRQQLIKEQADQRAADQQAEAKRVADQARKASSSVTGSSPAGASPGVVDGPQPTIRDELEKAFAQSRA